MAFISFESIWRWIIEAIYKTSQSRYEWRDFSEKAIKKDRA